MKQLNYVIQLKNSFTLDMNRDLLDESPVNVKPVHPPQRLA